jgi:peptidoglycan/xylan/chitin deacetylase (PgdA/CDA1 family)
MVDERKARRERQRRQIRRRRMLAAGALVVAFATVVVFVVSSGGSAGGDRGRGLSRRKGQRSTASDSEGSAPGEVRNATPQPDWAPYTGPVPILEYHVLGAAPADEPYPDLYVSRPDFHKQMNWLDEHGFEAVTLEQVEAAWYHGGTLPPKPVVISFDDGYRPQFTYALPELRRHGWAGVLNLKAEGSDLYPSNVEAMLAAGWELAAHTIHHLDLTELDAAQLKEEVAGSREILRREYGVPVDNFCYPAGQFDSIVIAAVEAAGYTGATTEIHGYADREHPYELDRYEILGSGGIAGMVADLR